MVMILLGGFDYPKHAVVSFQILLISNRSCLSFGTDEGSRFRNISFAPNTIIDPVSENLFRQKIVPSLPSVKFVTTSFWQCLISSEFLMLRVPDSITIQLQCRCRRCSHLAIRMIYHHSAQSPRLGFIMYFSSEKENDLKVRPQFGCHRVLAFGSFIHFKDIPNWSVTSLFRRRHSRVSALRRVFRVTLRWTGISHPAAEWSSAVLIEIANGCDHWDSETPAAQKPEKDPANADIPLSTSTPARFRLAILRNLHVRNLRCFAVILCITDFVRDCQISNILQFRHEHIVDWSRKCQCHFDTNQKPPMLSLKFAPKTILSGDRERPASAAQPSHTILCPVISSNRIFRRYSISN